jgi:hypothetical protein
MLRPITTSSASAGTAPNAVHAIAAADLSANEAHATAVAAAESARAQATGAGSAEQIFRYNSFEFIYRQDIGRIVLIGQSPETGERAYERTVRVERQMARIQSNRPAAPSATQPTSQPAPQLSKALMAAVSGNNHGSGVVSLSA